MWLLGGSPGRPCTVNNFQMDGIVVRVVVIIRGFSHDGSCWCDGCCVLSASLSTALFF